MSKTTQITVDADKAAHLQKIGNLSVDTLKILADKAGKPGIEQKLKTYRHFI